MIKFETPECYLRPSGKKQNMQKNYEKSIFSFNSGFGAIIMKKKRERSRLL
jgi:hypothetical protein